MKKSLLTLTAAAALGVCSFTSFGQNMAAVNAALARNQFGMQQQMMMDRMMTMNMARGSSLLYNPKTTFQVVLADSSVVVVKSKILFDDKHFSYLEVENKKLKKDDPNRITRLYPKDTRSIAKLGTYGDLFTPGLPADSCWLFKQVEGKINGYTFLPTSVNLHSGYFKFVQKDNGALQKLDKDTLHVMMQDNEKA